MMKTITQRLLILLVLLGLIGCTPSETIVDLLSILNPSKATEPPQSIEPGIQTNNIFGIIINTFDDAGGLAQLAETGSKWTRKDIYWSRIEPTPGARTWSQDLDQGLINLADVGVESVMILESTPSWALKEGFECGAVAVDKVHELAQFAYDMVRRYSAAPYHVRYWELWNEPDAASMLGCWGDPSDKEYYGGYYYGQMIQAVYPWMKMADPNAQVLVGGLLLDCDPVNPPEGRNCLPSKFIRGILASGGGPYFDGVAFHAYDFYYGEGVYANPNWHSSSSTTGPVSIAKASYLRSVLTEYGYEDKYLLNTETAVFYGPNVMDPPCQATEDVIPSIEVTKVNYVIHTYAVAVAEGWKANIWYSAFGVRCSGLLNSDLTPKDAYYAYQFAQEKLEGARYVRAISEYDGVMGYAYTASGRSLWVIWSLDGQAHVINLPEIPVEVNQVGKDGKAVKIPSALSMTLKDTPIFIEFEQ